MNSNTKVYHGGSAGNNKFSTSGGSTPPVTVNVPIILHTNYQYNDAEVVTMSERFIAWKLICKIGFIADAMGCFLYETFSESALELGLYSENGVRIARTGVKVLSPLHQEVQYDLQNTIKLVKGNQYWLGLWGNGASIKIASETGFGNLNSTFPSGIHCIDESQEPLLPANISTFSPGTQQCSIWARGNYDLP